ncbi:MAG: hypothetical protein JWQ54_1754 [Mucilaginibacter sp.]|nr:hypothetical protein [Mucilaginibacter sp.]
MIMLYPCKSNCRLPAGFGLKPLVTHLSYPSLKSAMRLSAIFSFIAVWLQWLLHDYMPNKQ